MTVIDFIAGSESSWVDWTEPKPAEGNVSRVDPFKIKFTRILDPLCLNSDVIKLFDGDGAEVIGAFLPISVGNDWDPIAKIVELRLAAGLNSETEYTLVIDGLYDAMGDSQDQPHTVSFITNSNDDTFVLDVSGPSQIAVEDHTISNADLVPAAPPAGQHTVFMNPSDGSYNIPSTTSQLMLIFSPADITEADIVVYRRPISTMEAPWELLAATGTLEDPGHVSIDLPLSGSGYVAPGYEYRASVITGNEMHDFYFAGELSPMFTSVQSVLFQSARLNSFLVARNIYLDSQYILSIDSSQGSNPSRAAGDYVLYNTLASLSPIDTMRSYSLADLSVRRKSSLQEKWAQLADAAMSKLQGGPKFLVKGSGNTNPHAKRDFGSSGTRIGQ